jgi:hypothetical protein
MQSASDPFFEVIPDGDWNACVGVQGDEENYVDGYLQAALELVAAVIDDKRWGLRDTLAMPILYNARHAVELSLKFAIKHLHEMGAIASTYAPNHDILAHWKQLSDAAIGDLVLRELIGQLEPFVTSLANVDGDGQELRYAESLDGKQSLKGLAVVNLKLIRASLEAMSDILKKLKYRVLDLRGERETGSYTTECSRSDLITIATMLGSHTSWGESSFLGKKAAAMAKFRLSGRKFSNAVDKIRQSRELAALVAIEGSLTHLTDEKVLFAATHWLSLHPLRERSFGRGAVKSSDIDFEEVFEYARTSRALDDVIVANLTNEEFSELEVLYYIGRDRKFGEHYEKMLASTLSINAKAESRLSRVHAVMSKTNFLNGLAQGCKVVGRLDLSTRA